MSVIVFLIALTVKYLTTDNHVVLFIYKRINDRVTHTKMRTQLKLDFRVFSYSVSSTDGWIGAVNTEIEHLLKENNIRNAGYFVFADTSMLLYWKYLYNHGAEMFAKTK